MSARNFQVAMATLIRFPEESWEEIHERTGRLELSTPELASLRVMAKDPLVRKYGYKMRYCRQRDATDIMRLSKEFISPSTLDRMYQEYFDPSRTSTDLFLIGVQFLEFVLGDERCAAALGDGVPFIGDLIAYDLAKAAVIRKVIDPGNAKLPKGSLLRHDALKVLNLKYDVPTIDRLKAKDPASFVAPMEKAMTVVFVHSDQSPYYRMFQIDGETGDFLTAQLEDPARWNGPPPKAYPGNGESGALWRGWIT